MSECADLRIGAWEELRPLLFDLFDDPEDRTRATDVLYGPIGAQITAAYRAGKDTGRVAAPERCPRCEPGAVCSSCVVIPSPVVDRDVLREACRRAYTAYDRARLNDAFDEDMVDACVKAAAPVIESALLDRIEKKVRLQGLVDPDSTDAWSNGWEAALDAVLTILTEIREGK